MYTQIKMHVYETTNTHIIVCIHSYSYPYKCMFTQKQMSQK